MKRRAIINPDTPRGVLDSLKKLDIEPVPVPRAGLVQPPLAGHPDLQLFPLGRRLFCRPGLPAAFLDRLEPWIEVVPCATEPGGSYPDDVPYNVAFAGGCAFHLASRTEPSIARSLAACGIPLVDVRQGYARCSTLTAGERMVITADRGIHAAALARGLDSLLITPGYVALPGYRYGFIGGASGAIDDLLFLTGNLDLHPDRDAIREHAEKNRVRLHMLSGDEIIDLGGIFIIDSA